MYVLCMQRMYNISAARIVANSHLYTKYKEPLNERAARTMTACAFVAERLVQYVRDAEAAAAIAASALDSSAVW